LRLDAEWRTWDRKRLHLTICHELLHCLTRDLDAMIEQLEAPLSGDAYSLLTEQSEHLEEQLIERISRALVSAFSPA
jgi:hypothetical protein